MAVASRSLEMRYGARGLRGVLMRRMIGERYRRGRRAPAFRPFRSHSLAPVLNHHGRDERLLVRASKSSRYSYSEGRASRPRHAATRCDRRAAHRLCTATPAHSATYPPLRELPRSGADIPVCARPRGQTGMSAPQYHAPSLRLAGTASPHLCWRAFADASPALDDNRQRLASGRQTPNSMTISRPYRASRFWPITQGVALGWYIAPLQGAGAFFGWTIIATTQWLAI